MSTDGVVSKGNGDCFLMKETHTSLSIGGGQAGQGYPCVVVWSIDRMNQSAQIETMNTLRTYAGGDNMPTVAIIKEKK